jgi:hypothetical protein
MIHCCEMMNNNIVLNCDIHKDVYECPDILISYIDKYDEYGIIIHDGGTSSISFSFCPWCGKKLPESKRDLWFDILEKMGFDNPTEQDIPNEFHNIEWFKKMV